MFPCCWIAAVVAIFSVSSAAIYKKLNSNKSKSCCSKEK